MLKGKTLNLVLAGGGVKGIALVGAIEVLEQAGYKVNRVAGTSAGAIVGGLVAAGFRSDELKLILQEIPYTKFRDESLLDRLGLPGKATSLLLEKGIYEGDFFCEWYDKLLGQKNIHTFSDIRLDAPDLPKNHRYKLVALASNISRGKLARLPWDLPDFGIDPDQQLVSEAVRASISIPFFYEPVRLRGDYLIDGAMLSNFAINIFEDDDIPTIGIKLSAEPGAADRAYAITGPVSYATAVLRTVLNSQDQIHLNDPQAIKQTIFVDTNNVQGTDFDITPMQQVVLYEAGRAAATKYLDKQR